jgi:arylmalonate decarboxylase
MTSSRRDFLKLGSAATAYGALGGLTLEGAEEPALGLIGIPVKPAFPSDAKTLYPTGVRFLINGVGLSAMTLEGYDEAIPRVVPRAQDLAKQGAKVISVWGSSLTFYKGAKFHDDLIQQVSKATGLVATTQSNGLLDGLRAANARRVALATAYTDVVTERLKIFLQEFGFEVTSAKGLGFEVVPDGGATHDILLKLGIDAYATSGRADALVMSCGALRTLDLIVPLEDQIKVPVVSSSPHGVMNGVRLLGVSPRVKGYGMLLAKA